MHSNQTPDVVAEAIQIGLEHHKSGRLPEAERAYRQVLEIDPSNPNALHLLGAIAHQEGKHETAFRLISAAIKYCPSDPHLLNNLGEVNRALQRPEEALTCYNKALAIKSDFAGAWSNRGIALQDLKRLAEALASHDQALAIEPDYAEALSNRGIVLRELKRFDEAIKSYDSALAIKPDYAEASYNRGGVLCDLSRFAEALTSYEKALTIKPDYAEAMNNRGIALRELDRHEEALASYDMALTVRPHYADALNNRGIVLQKFNRHGEALASYENALRIKPDFAEALCNLGNALRALERYEEALISYDKALAFKSDFAEALNGRGNALQELKRHDEALASYAKALQIKPDHVEALSNCGIALQKLKRYDEALASYTKALAIKPDFDYLLGACLHMKMQICDWRDLEEQCAKLLQRIEHGAKATQAGPVLAITDSARIQRRAAEIWVDDNAPARAYPPALSEPARRSKIRIGYYSADFRNHAVACLIAGLFEQHDRSKFELVAFSFGPDSDDVMRNRISGAFETFLDVRSKSDSEVALLSRDLGIDIAVDLNGYTADARVGIFSQRAAPLQVSFLGYPGTMGAAYIDYLIADRTLVPEYSQTHYSEKIVYMPNSYQVNDSKRPSAPATFARSDLGLPSTGFIFCCFNGNQKITAAMFDRWMRILGRVQGSVLWLLESSPTSARNLRNEATARGVDPARLIFAKRTTLPEHLARHRAADLFLDTLPYNAHTTASDALWAGLPVLTCMGESFASRVAASLLNAICMPELITTTPEQYEVLAIELAANHDLLAGFKRRLEENRLTAPLFDTRLYARHIEDAYTQMYERHLAGLPPAHFHVNGDGRNAN